MFNSCHPIFAMQSFGGSQMHTMGAIDNLSAEQKEQLTAICEQIRDNLVLNAKAHTTAGKHGHAEECLKVAEGFIRWFPNGA